MDYTAKIQQVRKRLEELRKIREALYGLEETLCAIENEICVVDESLPSDAEVAAMPACREKKQIETLFELDDQAFDIIDEILGPPDGDFSGDSDGGFTGGLNGDFPGSAPAGHSASGRTISLDDVLRQYGPASTKKPKTN